MSPHTDPELHLIDQASPQATPAGLARITDHLHERGLDPQRHLRWCGGSPMLAALHSVGLDPAGRLSTTRHLALAWSTLRRELRSWPHSTRVHAWSLSAVRAVRGVSLARPITAHLTALPDDAALRWLRAQRLPLVTAGRVLRDQLLASGFDPTLLTAADPTPLERARARLICGRDASRHRWGLADDVPVIAVLADPPRAQDAFKAAAVVNLVAEATGGTIRLLVHPHQHARPRAQTQLDRYGQPQRLLQDADLAAPWRVLPGCDAALLLDAPAPLAARYAVAAGLPIVAYDRPDHREALHGIDPDRVWWLPLGDHKKLADRLEHGALGIGGRP